MKIRILEVQIQKISEVQSSSLYNSEFPNLEKKFLPGE